MKWSELSAEHRAAIVDGAAARAAIGEAEGVPAIADRVTMADLADLARGRSTRLSAEAIRSALTDRAMGRMLDVLMGHYAGEGIPLAAAASTDAGGRRRDVEEGIEIEWVASSAEPETIFVRIVPSLRRPVHALVMRAADGAMHVLPLPDRDEIEVLLDRDSPEFRALTDTGSKLWLR